MTIGNPTVMRSQATRLRYLAEIISDMSADVGRRVDAMVPTSFEGPAADRFAHTILDQRASLARGTSHLQSAAARLDRAADEVEEEIRREALLRAAALDTTTGIGGEECEY